VPVAIVSGGSRGLGRAVLSRLLDAGWQVATFSRTAPDPPEPDDRILRRRLDVVDGAGIRAFVAEALDRFGRIDALVNNAGMAHEAPLLTARDEDVERVLATNLTGPIVLAGICARAMLRNGEAGGAIVNISSVNAVRGFRGVSVYSAAKAGLDGYTRSAARELGPRNIRVNSVAPGYFASDMTDGMPDALRAAIVRRTPLGRLVTAEEVAASACFLLSREAAAITGQVVVVDGGGTC
jgi:3-oxoacyl-[acyl-carrier protein] reductase